MIKGIFPHFEQYFDLLSSWDLNEKIKYEYETTAGYLWAHLPAPFGAGSLTHCVLLISSLQKLQFYRG